MSTHWFHSFVETAAVHRAFDALRERGVQLEPMNQREMNGPGVVFFEQPGSDIVDWLRERTLTSAERVLAVALSRKALGSSSWSLLQAGATDVVVWNACQGPSQIAAKLERWRDVDARVAGLASELFVGSSRALKSALRELVEIACFSDAPVLLEGESGTGKELAARLIHASSEGTNKNELVVLDCTTIVPELSGSEFFGHERGAFTGAAGPRDGAFALANGGTLFLDEVGELPLPLQAQLLRVVQERTYKRVGGNTWHVAQFRLICATNRDLQREVEQGTFRRDLYYRLASAKCQLPPLRERREDVLPLVRHFLAAAQGGEPPLLDPELAEYLLTREYPGNVRDLRQLAARLAYRHVSPGPLTVGALAPEDRPKGRELERDWRQGPLESAVRAALMQGAALKDIGRVAQELAVQLAVQQENGNLKLAALRLGVTDRALQLRRASLRGSDFPPPQAPVDYEDVDVASGS